MSRVTPAYVIWLAPAVLGAVLNWSQWLILVLLCPGLIWYIATQGTDCYREVRTTNPNALLGQRVPALAASPLFVGAIVFFPARLTGVFIITGFLLVDLAWWWRKGRRTGGDARPTAQYRSGAR
jgi:hypothetical protein